MILTPTAAFEALSKCKSYIIYSQLWIQKDYWFAWMVRVKLAGPLLVGRFELPFSRVSRGWSSLIGRRHAILRQLKSSLNATLNKDHKCIDAHLQ